MNGDACDPLAGPSRAARHVAVERGSIAAQPRCFLGEGVPHPIPSPARSLTTHSEEALMSLPKVS